MRAGAVDQNSTRSSKRKNRSSNQNRQPVNQKLDSFASSLPDPHVSCIGKVFITTLIFISQPEYIPFFCCTMRTYKFDEFLLQRENPRLQTLK